MGSGKKVGISIGVILIAIGIAYGVLGTGTESTTDETSDAPAVIEETSGLSGEVTLEFNLN